MYRNKRIIIIIVSALIIRHILLFVPFYKVYTELACVSEYVETQSVVYVPESIPVKFYYDPVGVFFGNDVFEYWRIKPDKKEREKRLKDVSKPQWSKIGCYGEYSMILERLSYFYGNIFSQWAKTSPLEDNCSYICLYDGYQNTVICDDNEAYYCSNIFVYIYDSDDNLYYCIHHTM